MLQKSILNDSSSLSARLPLHQQFEADHGFQSNNHRDLTSMKSSLPFLGFICRHQLTVSAFKNRSTNFVTKQKNNQRISVPYLESEKGGWKFNAYKDMINGVPQNPMSDPFHENLYAESGELDHKLQDIGYQLSHRKEHYEHPINYQSNLLEKLKAVHLQLLASEHWNSSKLKLCDRIFLVSAINLTHYLALRRLDHIQELQEDLASMGLLNFESIKISIIFSISACIQLLENQVCKFLSNQEDTYFTDKMGSNTQTSENLGEFAIKTMKKRALLQKTALFGPAESRNSIHIMVTIGREALLNEMLLMDLIKSGANVIRINCAHDDPTVWSEIIRITKNSSHMLEKPCRILMDLAGPKLRIGILKMDPNAVKLKPKKDGAMGDILLPAQSWLCCAGSSGPPAQLSVDAVFHIDQKFIKNLKEGSVLRFVDFRGRKRSLILCMQSPLSCTSGYLVECMRIAYVGLGTKFYIKAKDRWISIGKIVKMPVIEQFIRLKVGDLLTICRSSFLSMDKFGGGLFVTTRITCDSEHLFRSVKLGDPIAFDDGKIWGEIQRLTTNEVIVLITHASSNGSTLGPGKSINIPKSEMDSKGLTAKDLVDLDFVAANADMVGISFIRDANDVAVIQHELEKRRLRKLGIVLKIETRDAVEKLPSLLFQAMQSENPLGVMIARGDLMVECGWEAMASIQEDILSLCIAAHIPVIWATQVLESLVKFGMPTRAEISDVSSGMRASCIMLNKGEHIVEAVSALTSILANNSSRIKNKSMSLNIKN